MKHSCIFQPNIHVCIQQQADIADKSHGIVARQVSLLWSLQIFHFHARNPRKNKPTNFHQKYELWQLRFVGTCKCDILYCLAVCFLLMLVNFEHKQHPPPTLSLTQNVELDLSFTVRMCRKLPPPRGSTVIAPHKTWQFPCLNLFPTCVFHFALRSSLVWLKCEPARWLITVHCRFRLKYWLKRG